jgi:hypothetical protein
MTGIVLDVKYRPETSSYEKLKKLSDKFPSLEAISIVSRAEDMSYSDLIHVLNRNDVFYMDLPNFSNQLLQRVMEILSTKYKKIIYTPELEMLLDSWKTFPDTRIRSTTLNMHTYLIQSRNTLQDANNL